MSLTTCRFQHEEEVRKMLQLQKQLPVYVVLENSKPDPDSDKITYSIALPIRSKGERKVSADK